MATILVLLASALLLALGGSVALATATESRIATSYRDGVTTMYAAEAGAAIAAARLTDGAEWTASDGAYLSGRIDRLLGVADEPRPPVVTVFVSDGGAVDRLAIVSQAQGPGGARRMVRVTVARATDAGGRPALRVAAWEEVR